MKMTSVVRRILAITFAFSLAASAQAQWVDGNGDPVINPNSGGTVSPCLRYDPATGILSVLNAGPNFVTDSTDNLTLLGDDVGMISLLLTYNGDASDVSAVLPVFADGIAWSAPTVFNGKIQLSGNAIAASFLPISLDPVPVAQLPTGLSLQDFLNPSTGNVEAEMGINFEFNSPGATVFASDFVTIFCIPEPTASVLGIPPLVLLARRRRRFRSHDA